MATDIEAQMAYIVGNCTLDSDADAVLHVVIGEFSDGVGAMRVRGKTGQAERGVGQIVAALNDYGKYFAHPGGKPVGTAH